MGCWNKTCGLTGLHIYSGTDTYVFVLEKNNDATERCYSTAFWSPILLPFYAEYNDYGGGENASGVALPYIIEGLKRDLIEMEQGENEYHDIPVKKDGFDVDQFFEAVHEGRLSIGSYNGDRMIDFVMLRKDAVDRILANRVIEQYVGGGKCNCGWNNNYIQYKFEDILADIPEFLAAQAANVVGDTGPLVQAAIRRGASEDELNDLRASLRMIRYTRSWGEVFDFRHPNKVGRYMQGSGYRFSSIVRIGEIVTDLVVAGETEKATQLMTDHMKALFINDYMGSIRKNWAPGGHEGSQNADLDEYYLLIDTMKQVMDIEKAEYEDD